MYSRKPRSPLAEIILACFILVAGAAALFAFTLNLPNQHGQPDTTPWPSADQQTPVTVVETEGLISLENRPVQVLEPSPPAQLENGQIAPDFRLQTLEGDWIYLSDFQGQAVIVNFWTSWCGGCREEAPELVAAYQQYQDDGLIILAVNMLYQDDLTAAQAFVDEFALPFPVLLDESGAVSDDRYHVLGVPTSIFITRDGHIQNQVVGAMSGSQLAQLTTELLRTTYDY